MKRSKKESEFEIKGIENVDNLNKRPAPFKTRLVLDEEYDFAINVRRGVEECGFCANNATECLVSCAGEFAICEACVEQLHGLVAQLRRRNSN